MERTLEQVREDIKNAKAEIENLIKASEEGKRSFTDEENTKFDKLTEQYEADQKLEQTMVRGDRAKQLFNKRSEVFGGPSNVGIGVSKKRAVTHADKCNTLRAFLSVDPVTKRLSNHADADMWKRSCDMFEFDWTNNEYNCRAQSTDVSGEGDDAVNGSVLQGFISAKQWEGTILEHCDVQYTDNADPVHHTFANDLAAFGAYSAQNAAIDNVSVVMDKVTLNSYTAKTGVFPISLSLIRDSRFDVMAYLNSTVGDRLRRTVIRDVSIGDGSGNAQGIFYAGVATEGAEAYSNYIYSTKVRELEYSVDAEYRVNGKWFACDDTISKMELTLVDVAGAAEWANNLQLGTPNVLRGRPLLNNRHVQAMSPGNVRRPLYFGDFSYHKVRFVGQPLLVRSNELLINKLAVAIFGAVEFDSRYVNPGNNPIKYIQTGDLANDATYVDSNYDMVLDPE